MPTAPFTPPPDAAKAYRVVRHGDLWLPMRQIRHRLPAERDAFVGRGEDLVELVAPLLGGARLVSLLGIGGTGKTRLALRYGWTWLGTWTRAAPGSAICRGARHRRHRDAVGRRSTFRSAKRIRSRNSATRSRVAAAAS